jgi:hypothetical protein
MTKVVSRVWCRFLLGQDSVRFGSFAGGERRLLQEPVVSKPLDLVIVTVSEDIGRLFEVSSSMI